MVPSVFLQQEFLHVAQAILLEFHMDGLLQSTNIGLYLTNSHRFCQNYLKNEIIQLFKLISLLFYLHYPWMNIAVLSSAFA